MRFFLSLVTLVIAVFLTHGLAAVPAGVADASADRDYELVLDEFTNGDRSVAIAELHSQARAGNPAAETLLGAVYDRGLDVEKDPGAAVIWYYRAARSGYPLAQFALGSAYLDGNGVAENSRRAYSWLALAARRAPADLSRQAHSKMREAARRLSPQELAAARNDVDNWRPSLALILVDAP